MRPGSLALFGMLLAAAPLVRGQSIEAPPARRTVAATALRRIDVETSAPVRVITRQDLAHLTHLGLGEALQRLPFMGGSAANLNSNAAGDGSVIADIGGLGPARCIVMLNGQRLPVNEFLGAPAVDLDAIPVAAIDRVEIFLGGASSTWGADAVSGVINIITRSEADGMDLSATTSRSSRGDGAMNRASVFGGKVFSRGHASFTAEYRKEDPVQSTSRTFSKRSEALGCASGSACVWPFGSTATPAGVFLVPEGNALGLAPGRYTADSAGNWRPFLASGPANDLYSTQGDSYLRDGRTGGSATASIGYEFSDATSVTFDMLAAKDRTHRRLAPLPLTTTTNTVTAQTFVGFPAALLPAQVAADNFYNPFGVGLTDVRRRLIEFGPRSIRDDSDMMFASATVRHDTGAWQLEGSLSWGHSSVTEHTSAAVRDDRLALALGPSGRDSSGNIRCGVRDAATGIVNLPLADCVPLDVFDGPGSVSPEMLSYVTAPAEDEARVQQTQVSAIARRELDFGNLRPARLAAGLESRRLTLHSNFADDATGFNVFASPSGGSVSQNDLIAELAWPWSNRGEDSSMLTLGGRLSWTRNVSPLGSAFAALAWRPTAQWLMRGRVSQVYRAPSAGELFLGRRQRTLPLGSPCLAAGAQATTLCASTANSIEPATSAPAFSATESEYFTAGNPDLRPERGYSAGAGLVWNSAVHTERFASLDLTWIRLEDAIRAPGALELVTACRDGTQAAACARIVPVLAGGAFAVDGSLINGGRDQTARLDFEARDAWDTDWGNWRLELAAGYLLEHRLTDINGNHIDLRGTFDVTQSVTGTAYPTAQARSNVGWTLGNWTADWAIQYIGSYREVRDRNGLLPVAAGNGSTRRVGAVMYHDVTLAWASPSAYTLRLGVENLFDRFPPRVNNGLEANTDAPTYRLDGRLFFLSVEISR